MPTSVEFSLFATQPAQSSQNNKIAKVLFAFKKLDEIKTQFAVRNYAPQLHPEVDFA